MTNSAVFLSKKEIQAMVSALAAKVDSAYKASPKPLILIAPLKGSVFFLADFARALKIKSVIDFTLIESVPEGGFSIAKDISLPVKGRHALIVKEVLNSGRKMLFLKKRLLAGGAETVKIAALLDKPSLRAAPLQPDFIGHVVPDRYLFGYGMDMEEKGRALEEIRHLTQ